jgi:hypothetical protein
VIAAAAASQHLTGVLHTLEPTLSSSSTTRRAHISETSPQTEWIADQEVERLVEAAHTEVSQLLSGNRDRRGVVAGRGTLVE